MATLNASGQELSGSILVGDDSTLTLNLTNGSGFIGSITGSVFSSFLFVACSEWWLRFLDEKQMIGSFEVPLLRNGFRLVVFSIIIMVVVLFFRRGIMGTKELPDLFRKKRKEAAEK